MNNQPFTTQILPQKGIINFGIGQPDPTVLPLAEMQQAAAHRLAKGDCDLLNYGYESGDGFFRQALANLLSKNYGKPVNPAHLFTTGSASHGLDLLCTLLTQAGDTVLVEEPTYFLVYQIFKDRHLNVVSVPFKENGYDFEAIEDAVKKHKPKFFYTIPAFQNPATHSISAEDKQQLVQLSQSLGFYIVADEVYQLLGYSETPPPPFGDLIDAETVFSVGTFSKILAPGLRLGWIQTAPKFIEQLATLGVLISGGGLNHFTSNIVTSMIELGLQEDYLNRLKAIYGRRVNLMDSMLKSHFGNETNHIYEKPGGG
ncbi:MAG: PLP-dependent aminotransferase family protein, partial [Chloroflexota bacterium]